jgi:hypothetical protein
MALYWCGFVVGVRTRKCLFLFSRVEDIVSMEKIIDRGFTLEVLIK